MAIDEILRGNAHGLLRFDARLVEALEKRISRRRGKFYAECVVRAKSIQMTPEEVVRQLYAMELTKNYRYPVSRVKIEHPIKIGRDTKRADIVVTDKNDPNTAYIVVEAKSPSERDDGKGQLKSYVHATGAPMAVWTNGVQVAYYRRKSPNLFDEIKDIPKESQSLRDILRESWTMADLERNDELLREGASLKKVVETLEDKVLANSGGDSFEEVFKLIFAKLYDEWYVGYHSDNRNENLRFYNAGESNTELKEKIRDLFRSANERWEGVFPEGADITLTPSHLAVCVGYLERIKLLNSNLDVVDDAFEFLINKVSKGEKGQYFTPRYVIDMCVKMLDPGQMEYMIDTAAGSSGFPIHTIFHVWKKILAAKNKKQSHLFTGGRKPRECEEYVAKRVFAIDFDERAVRVSRALNVIAGDGESNVLHLNTLNYPGWSDEMTEAWQNIYNQGKKGLYKLRKEREDNRDYLFDIVMANPPFAGDINEGGIIQLYELGRKIAESDGERRRMGWRKKVSRHILFIERNLQFLKPGGRMAIVLPQGVFNNATNYAERAFIAEHCRILGVVGLHVNTFKPHTGVKTSVLFVQKWNDDEKAGPLCPRTDNYNIFFATMQKQGKRNNGNKIFLRQPQPENGDKAEAPKVLRDENRHMIVEHDLFNLWSHHFADGGDDGIKKLLDEQGIAEAFLEFAQKEGLSFAKTPARKAAPNNGKSGKPAAKTHRQVSDALLSKLGLSDLCISDGRDAVKTLQDSFGASGRLDAEYYQPKYDDIVRAVKKTPGGFVTVGDAVRVKDAMFEPQKDKVYDYIELADITLSGEIQGCSSMLGEDLPSRARRIVKTGDVIVSSVDGSLSSIALIGADYNNALCSTGFHVVDSKVFNSETLLLLFRSIIGQLQLQRGCNGSILTAINNDELKKIVLPVVSAKAQADIKKIVAEAQQLRARAKELLDKLH